MKHFSIFLALAALSLACATESAWGQQSVATPDAFISTPVVDMHSKPDDASDVSSQVIYGSGIKQVEQKGEWVNIRTGDDYTGWIHAAQLRAITNYATGTNAVHVTALGANLYSEPDVTTHAVLLQLPFESKLEAASPQKGENERWLAVKLVDGTIAWIQRGDVSSGFAPMSIDEMIAFAHRFLGITYTWGGVSTHGFDCSGFTQMLERQRGIVMPRDADVQANWNRVIVIKRSDLAPGDLLFFGRDTDHITHTGMYIGHGDFIHDTVHEHPGVQISHLDDAPWTTLLVAARRIK